LPIEYVAIVVSVDVGEFELVDELHQQRIVARAAELRPKREMTEVR
jgi:hypothetical protein